MAKRHLWWAFISLVTNSPGPSIGSSLSILSRQALRGASFSAIAQIRKVIGDSPRISAQHAAPGPRRSGPLRQRVFAPGPNSLGSGHAPDTWKASPSLRKKGFGTPKSSEADGREFVSPSTRNLNLDVEVRKRHGPYTPETFLSCVLITLGKHGNNAGDP